MTVILKYTMNVSCIMQSGIMTCLILPRYEIVFTRTLFSYYKNQNCDVHTVPEKFVLDHIKCHTLLSALMKCIIL